MRSDAHTLISPRYMNSMTNFISTNFIPFMMITGCCTWCCLNNSWNTIKLNLEECVVNTNRPCYWCNYTVSHLTWHPPWQHATAAVSKLPGNELVTTQNIAIACSQVGSNLHGALCAIRNFTSHICLLVLKSNTIHSELLTALLNKPQIIITSCTRHSICCSSRSQMLLIKYLRILFIYLFILHHRVSFRSLSLLDFSTNDSLAFLLRFLRVLSHGSAIFTPLKTFTHCIKFKTLCTILPTILGIVYKRLMCVVKSTMWPEKHVARQQRYLVSAL
jgi:hypothetical protein